LSSRENPIQVTPQKVISLHWLPISRLCRPEPTQLREHLPIKEICKADLRWLGMAKHNEYYILRSTRTGQLSRRSPMGPCCTIGHSVGDIGTSTAMIHLSGFRRRGPARNMSAITSTMNRGVFSPPHTAYQGSASCRVKCVEEYV
jgi:hypothetical protein